jgi:LmbE family N-acetylglucosaminyl deacetylase
VSADATQLSHVFLSPHFDDAVLSCGGTIAKLAGDGHAVTVITTMGAAQVGEIPDSPILADLHRRWAAGSDPLRTRRDEDIQALQSLGVEFRHLPLADCVYRQVAGRPLYPCEESLFGPVHPQDYAADFLIQNTILDLSRPQIAYLPLAVGHHVDHQIVHAWGLHLQAQDHSNLRLRFYAEFPYSNAPRAIVDAVQRFGAGFSVVRIAIEEADLRAKIGAIACYRSQISTFWDDLAEMEADVRRATSDSATGALVERYWEFD